MKRSTALVATLGVIAALDYGFGLVSRSGLAASPPPTTLASSPADADARGFALRAIDVLEREDFAAWHDLLSTPVLLRTDEASLRRTFDRWRRFALAHTNTLRRADWTLGRDDVVRYRAAGTAPAPLARVVVEDGELKLDDV